MELKLSVLLLCVLQVAFAPSGENTPQHQEVTMSPVAKAILRHNLGELLLTTLRGKLNRLDQQLTSLTAQVSSIHRKLGASPSARPGARTPSGTCSNACDPTSPRDCRDIQNSLSDTPSGVYSICVGMYLRPIDVYCDMDTAGGGWIVFQRRKDGSQNFYRGWNEYTFGFGDVTGEFWLGNENMYAITGNSGRTYRMRVDMGDWSGETRSAEYSHFTMASHLKHYKLKLGPYQGNAGDSLRYHHRMEFTTMDQDHDTDSTGNCARSRKGAWWYKECHKSNLNGAYYINGTCPNGTGVIWEQWHGNEYSLKWTEMKMRP